MKYAILSVLFLAACTPEQTMVVQNTNSVVQSTASIARTVDMLAR